MAKKNKEILNYASLAISVISSVFCNKKVTDFNTDNWEDFIKFCAEHKILNIVAFGLKNSDVELPEKIKRIFNENVLRSMMIEAQRSTEIELLCDDFEANKIPHIVLKGFVIKNLYPQPYLRSMGDVDILVGNELQKAAEIMLNHGYSFDSEEFLHGSFSKGKGLHIELHKSLIDESLDKYHSYFGTGFERARLIKNKQFSYEFSKEDYYIFLIAHMAKHYQICGTGIRSVCDVFVYNSAYKNELDYDYIASELDKTGLKSFEKKMRDMSFKWFSGSFNGKFDAVGEYIISSGVYGKSTNHELNDFLLNDKKKQSKFKYILTTIFPEKNYMQARYSVLKKHPFLLPFYWIKRIFSTLIKSSGSIRYRLKGVALSDKNDSKRFDDAGLK
ncbi:MAG: nucleotidyltransferase family protein [Clostridia bacterium]|nr:nucleotidyltransferase family protein [Clostridia bacterium]